MKLMKYEMVICSSEGDDCYIDTNFTKFIDDHRHFFAMFMRNYLAVAVMEADSKISPISRSGQQSS